MASPEQKPPSPLEQQTPQDQQSQPPQWQDEIQLSVNQVRLLRKAFSAFEDESKKTIPVNEIGTILEMLGCPQNQYVLVRLWQEFDPYNSGGINFDSFCKLSSRFLPEEENPEKLQQELREAFRLYDKEGNGYITVEVMREILAELDHTLSDEDLDDIMDEIDADGSGTVDLQGNGFISVNILRELLSELDDQISKEDIDEMIQDIDSDGSGTIDLNEFMEVMTGADD